MLTIAQLRKKIEKTDATIIKKLAERKKLSKKIGLLKAQSGKNVFDDKREKKLMSFYENLSTQYQLSPRFIQRLFKMIITDSRKLQK